ncbi:MAG TPA: hypothetical protein DCZ91_14260 [Lachnospiraceae bacterium]|nr:hypothetical protein [Lachnospiraceae bacterium]
MKIYYFIKGIYGSRIYFQTAVMMFLSFIVAAAQFLATQHLGSIIDAVEKGLEETFYHFSTIAVSLLIYIIGSGAVTFYGGKMLAGFVCSMQVHLGAKICSVQYPAMEQTEEGELLAMVTRDIDSIKNWIELVMKCGVLPVCLGIVPATLFQWCNWKFALCVLCAIPLNAVPGVLFSQKLSPFHEKEKSAYARVLSHFTDSLQFIMLIKAFQLEQIFRDRHREKLDEYGKIRKKRLWLERLAEEYNRCFGHISSILLLFLSAYFIYSGEMTLGRLTSIILLANFVGEGLLVLGSVPLCLPAAKAGTERIRKFFELQDEDMWDRQVQAFQAQKGMPVFEMRELSFSYGNTVVLQDINCLVEEGEKIAVVGFSGSGKTTLFKLLGGLYTTGKNQVYFRGNDMAELSLQVIREQITVAAQEAFLFQAAFRDNIKIAKAEGGEEELIAACKNAQLDPYIRTLAGGYDTEVNTTVQSVSKGQMQRINLARAFLKAGDILLLDEPVSALDCDTAGAIWDYLFSDCADRTLLVILHDLEEVQRFDKVLVLSEGKAAAFGTHDELFRSCELYRKLYQEKMANRKKGQTQKGEDRKLRQPERKEDA